MVEGGEGGGEEEDKDTLVVVVVVARTKLLKHRLPAQPVVRYLRHPPNQ